MYIYSMFPVFICILTQFSTVCACFVCDPISCLGVSSIWFFSLLLYEGSDFKV